MWWQPLLLLLTEALGASESRALSARVVQDVARLRNETTLAKVLTGVVDAEAIVRHLGEVTYADLMWNQWFEGRFWPHSPHLITVQGRGRLRAESAKAWHQSQRQVVYESSESCVSTQPVLQEKVCRTTPFVKRVQLRTHINETIGAKVAGSTEVSLWDETSAVDFTWNHDQLESTVDRSLMEFNVASKTYELPSNSQWRVQHRIEQAVLSGSLILSSILSSDAESDDFTWDVRACALTSEAGDLCAVTFVGPFDAQRVCRTISQEAKAALCASGEDDGFCLLRVNYVDGKIHAQTRARFHQWGAVTATRSIWEVDPAGVYPDRLLSIERLPGSLLVADRTRDEL